VRRAFRSLGGNVDIAHTMATPPKRYFEWALPATAAADAAREGATVARKRANRGGRNR
jgi:hypothetical protein